MSKKTGLVIILVLVMLCALLVLCSAVGYLSWKFIVRNNGTPTAQTPLVEQTSGTSGSSGGGGTLRLAGDLPPTLDPALAQDSTSAEYIVELYSGLMTLNSKLEIVPDLAERWELSEDGRTYTFHLRPTAAFADGRAISAEDFAYSLERACNPKTESPTAASYLGDIVGVPEMLAGKAEHIAGLKVVDAQTLQITIDAPKAYFLAKLTYPTAFVVDRAQLDREGANWTQKPNGSGPFRLESLGHDQIVLVRNEHYYSTPPALQRVEYVVSGGSPMTMYENGQLDIVGVSPNEIERVQDPDNPLHAELVMGPEMSVQYLAFNVKAPPFDDVAVRQAFAQAIDKKKLAELVLKDTATAAKGVLPAAMVDYFDTTLAGLPYDPEHARQLLAGSKYGAEGAMPPVVLTTSGTSAHMPQLEGAILSMIEKNLGVQMTVEQVEWSAFLRDQNERNYQLLTAGWIADYPDPQDFLDILFHSQSPQNHMAYSNPQVDKLLEQARLESDHARRVALYHQAEALIVNEAPWVPLTHGAVHMLVKPYVKGFQTSGSSYPWLKDITLAK